MAVIRIPVAVNEKIASVPCGTYIVADNTNYQLDVTFDEEWTEYETITARFVCGNWVCDRAVQNASVLAPMLPPDYATVQVGFYAGDISTTTPAIINISGSIKGQAPSIDEVAELARVQAEAQRVEHENARISAEESRVEAEESRVAAEEAREVIKTEMQNATTAANAATARADTAAQSALAAAGNAIDAANGAMTAAAAANAAADNANTKATAAQTAADNAAEAANAANAAASAATTAAANANAKAAAADAAAERANTAAQAAEAVSEVVAQLDTRVTTVENALAEHISEADAYFFIIRINEFGPKKALKLFLERTAPQMGLTEAVSAFFTAAAVWDDKVYASSFYLYSVSPSPVGVKRQANEGLVAVPSTSSSQGRDDYADIPLFACFDCNYTIDAATLEPVIHAIKDVYGEFSAAPSNSLVGVIQMTGWVRRSVSDTEKTVEYAAKNLGVGFKPLPEAVRASDNSVRPFVIHAKYAAGFDSLSQLSSVSGVQPVTGIPTEYGGGSITHDGQAALWRARGRQYGGFGICEQNFLQTMLEIKYANLGSANIMSGCRNYDLSYTAAVSETGVRRILLTPAQGRTLIVGSSVSLGTSGARADASCYSVSPIKRIAGISSVSINGEDYAAVSIDTDADFDVTQGDTYITTQPWRTGSTDPVYGSDGSPYDNLSGVEPFKLQGIEVMLGADEVAFDTLLYDNGSTRPYNVVIVREATNVSTGNDGGTDSEIIATIIKKSGSAGARYIEECNWEANSPEGYIAPSATGGTSSTGYCAALWQTSGSSGRGFRQYMMCGNLSHAGTAGLACISADYNRSTLSALAGCRACGTAGNRGVYQD